MSNTNDLCAGYGSWNSSKNASKTLPGKRTRRDHKAAKSESYGLDWFVETTVVPHLVSARKAGLAGAVSKATAGERAETDRVKQFADLVLHNEVPEICGSIEARRATGISLEKIYLTLLAPTAYRLHHLWTADVCGFAETVLALWRLQQVLREFSVAFRSEFVHREHGLRVLLAPAPGERHDLGYAMFCLSLVSEFFLREGWDTWIESDTTSDDFSDVVRSQWFDVIELLVCGDKAPDELDPCIDALRGKSSNHSVGIAVCGQPFINNPASVRFVVGKPMTMESGQRIKSAGSIVRSYADHH